MAYTEEQWTRAKAYYEAGLTLSKIKEKTGIARNTVSQRAKKEHWEHKANADYIEAREVLSTKKGTILEQKGTLFLNTLDEVADDNIRRKNLVFGTTELLIKKTAEFIENGKASKVVTEGQGNGMSMGMVIEHDLQSSDFKNIADTIHKAGQTLGVIDNKPDVQINNENVQQNAIKITIDE